MPTIIASKSPNTDANKYIAPFIKEFTARWYNNTYDKILNAWLEILFSNEKEIVVSAFDEGMNGINATFKLSRTTAYTRL
jgi:hypothetical protein